MEHDVHPAARREIEAHLFTDASCLLFDPRAQDGHVLDAFGALVWDYCDGALNAGEIAAEIAALVPAYSDAREHVFALLDEFAGRGLLVARERVAPDRAVQ